MRMTTTHATVSPEEWEAARLQLLVKEKELTRARDALAAERRRMPWLAVEKEYGFDGPHGKASLLDLFDGRRQLIVYRAFFEPGVSGWPEHACIRCSLVADQVDTAILRLSPSEQTAITTDLTVALTFWKAINDRLGHAVGDALLVVVAARLRGCVRGGSREGGTRVVGGLVGGVRPLRIPLRAHAGRRSRAGGCDPGGGPEPVQAERAAMRRSGGRVGGGCLRSGRTASSSAVTSAIWRTARSNASSVAAEVFCTPLTLRTYCRAAASTSSGVAAGSSPRRVVMLRHMAARLPRGRSTADRWHHLDEEGAAGAPDEPPR